MHKISRKVYFFSFLNVVFFCLFGCKQDLYNSEGLYTPINRYQEGEENLTSDLSVFATNDIAFGREVPGLTYEDKMRFASGNSLFDASWVTAPASTSGLDGLGPTFNARSCSSCHFKDGRGRPSQKTSFGSRGFLMRLSIPGIDANGGPKPHPIYGDQIQDHSILNVPNEADVKITYEFIKGTYPDGTSYELRKPSYNLYNESFGTLNDSVMFSPRVGTQTIGLGLVDALPESELLKYEDVNDSDNDGISGKANYVWNIKAQKHTIGKFGWKANMPTLEQQISGAFHGDMGLSSPLLPSNACPPMQEGCNQAPNGGEPEVTATQMDRMLLYQSALAVPKRRKVKDKNVLEGKVLFNDLNCVGCHQTNFTTGSYAFNPVLENKVIHPFSDFLLHDMGEGLADNRPDFKANGREWRTQPLWGIGLIKTVNKHTFLLHDGRARNVEEAILWHGGEAENSVNAFKNLTKQQREQVITYVNSL